MAKYKNRDVSVEAFLREVPSVVVKYTGDRRPVTVSLGDSDLVLTKEEMNRLEKEILESLEATKKAHEEKRKAFDEEEKVRKEARKEAGIEEEKAEEDTSSKSKSRSTFLGR